MTDKVNDALGLTQFITKHLGEDQAVSYLQAIEGLTIQDWKEAKDLLTTVNKTKRHSKEGNIRDIVQVFINEVVETSFLVRNLALCPGFQIKAIETVSYTAATLEAIHSVSLRMVEQQVSLPQATTNKEEQTQRSSKSDAHAPGLPVLTATHSNEKTNQVTSTFSGWAKEKTLPYKSRSATQNLIKKKNVTIWTHGTGACTDDTQKPQLKFICLGIKSGPDETIQSLTSELKLKWKKCRDLEVEIVSQSQFSTMFRVKFNIAAAHSEQWRDPSFLPTRLSASVWRGNPRIPLKPLSQRIYRKKLYIGGLAAETTGNQITENMKQIYSNEIEGKTINNIETLINQGSLNKFACVILTSHPGKPLVDVTLKLNHYPYKMQRMVRWWRGLVPYPDNHEMVRPQLDLRW